MKINPRIKETLREYKLNPENGTLYLLSLHYNIKDNIIPDSFKIQIHSTKIVEAEGNKLKWNIPLFEEEEGAFAWVKTEYVELFRIANKATNSKEAISRMKKFFANNPEYRKDDVLNATKMYLSETDMRYIRAPHYFIEKGIGVDKVYDLLTWVEKYKEEEDLGQGRSSLTNTIE
jgi:hypothetical protein